MLVVLRQELVQRSDVWARDVLEDIDALERVLTSVFAAKTRFPLVLDM